LELTVIRKISGHSSLLYQTPFVSYLILFIYMPSFPA